MRKEKQVNLVEDAMRRAYKAQDSSSLSDEWKSSLMAIVQEDEKVFEIEKQIEKRFLYFSWIAAGIAAALIIVSGMLYSFQSYDIENDIQELYSDDTLETITMEIASK